MNWLQWQTMTSSRKASKNNNPEVCDARSLWMIDCRKLDGTDRDKKLEIHVGRNSRIMKSILGSKDYELHNLFVGTSRFLSAKNVLIMIRENGRCKSCCERRVSVKYVESLWQTTCTLSKRCICPKAIFGRTQCAGRCPECREQAPKTFQIHHGCVRAECSRLAAAIGSETEHWKPRRESHGQTEIDETNASIESNTKQGTLSELAERLGNFHESADALTLLIAYRLVTPPARRIRVCSRPPRACSQNYWRKRTTTWTVHFNHQKTTVPKPLGTEAAALVPRHRARVLALLRRQRLKHLVLTLRQKSK